MGVLLVVVVHGHPGLPRAIRSKPALGSAAKGAAEQPRSPPGSPSAPPASPAEPFPAQLRSPALPREPHKPFRSAGDGRVPTALSPGTATALPRQVPRPGHRQHLTTGHSPAIPRRGHR